VGAGGVVETVGEPLIRQRRAVDGLGEVGQGSCLHRRDALDAGEGVAEHPGGEDHRHHRHRAQHDVQAPGADGLDLLGGEREFRGGDRRRRQDRRARRYLHRRHGAFVTVN